MCKTKKTVFSSALYIPFFLKSQYSTKYLSLTRDFSGGKYLQKIKRPSNIFCAFQEFKVISVPLNSFNIALYHKRILVTIAYCYIINPTVDVTFEEIKCSLAHRRRCFWLKSCELVRWRRKKLLDGRRPAKSCCSLVEGENWFYVAYVNPLHRYIATSSEVLLDSSLKCVFLRLGANEWKNAIPLFDQPAAHRWPCVKLGFYSK